MFRKSKTTSSNVVQTETKTSTSVSGGEKITITEIIETFDDGSVKKSTNTVKEKVTVSNTRTVNTSQGYCSLPAASSPAVKPISSPSAKPISNGPPAKIGDFQKDSLERHNYYRKKHGVAPLKLNPQLCSYAQEWANHLASTRRLQHRSPNSYGENLYSKMTSDPNYVVTGQEAVDSWYSEIKDYKFGSGFSSGTGHFTQVVWKESAELGIACATAPGGWHYVVANYDPAGNMMGSFPQNVFPPK